MYDDGHQYCYAGHGLIKGNLEDFVSGFTYEYLPWRNVSKEIMKFYDVKTKIDPEGKPVTIGFQWPDSNLQFRDLDEKKFYCKPGKTPVGLFGRDKFAVGSHKYVTITEGAIDALSLADVLSGSEKGSPPPVVSVQSASSAFRDITVDRAWLNTFERIYFAFDGDEPGRQALHKCAKLFDYHKVYVVPFTKRKDANEHLLAGERDDLKRIWWSSKQYLPENILTTLDQFKTAKNKPKRHGIPYPFKILTDMTDGIRTGESVLIMAPEKVGKTELMRFIEHKILKETDDHVASFFIEDVDQRHFQALAGIELGLPIHLPNVDCPTDKSDAALETVIRRDDRLHYYDKFGSDDGERFLDTLRFLAVARNCRYVLVDHISILISGLSGRKDERRDIDYLSTRLEMLVKELDIALIIVSHVNDEGKSRGSRYPTKVFDITITAERDTMADNEEDRRAIKLSIPYSRFPGITGPAGVVIFNRDTYSFTERAHNEATAINWGNQGVAA